jgi:hypothetical protein
MGKLATPPLTRSILPANGNSPLGLAHLANASSLNDLSSLYDHNGEDRPESIDPRTPPGLDESAEESTQYAGAEARRYPSPGSHDRLPSMPSSPLPGIRLAGMLVPSHVPEKVHRPPR